MHNPLDPACAVLTDEPDNEVVWKALPIINKHLKAQAEEAEEVEEAEEESEEGDDDDDDEGEEEEEEEEEEEDDDDEEDADGADGEDRGGVVAENGVPWLTAATSGLAIGSDEPPTPGTHVRGLHEDIRGLVDSLVEEDATQVYR